MKRWALAVAIATALFFPLRAVAQELTVTVTGEVKHPGVYIVERGDKLSSLIERAGGFTDNAFLRGATLSRESARAQKEKPLRDSISRLEREAFAKPGEEDQKRDFLNALSTLKPAKRTPVRLAHPRLLKGSEDDLPLEEDDALFVPARTDKVEVIGAVKTPGTVSPSSPKTDPEECIRKAGGYSENGDRKHAYVIRADGAVIPLSREPIRWNPGESRWEILVLLGSAPQIESGDSIVVPKKPGRASWARNLRDLPRLLMEIHVLTGVRIDPP